VTVLSIIRDCLDALLHPSARYDALTRARHRAFMAPRLLGSLAAFAAFPVYLVLRGAPSAIEVAAFAWLIAPIMLSWFLSRTGRYEGAHVLSSLALAGLIMAIAATTGGIESFAAIWLVVVPLEAALSASRRVAAFASLLALSCAGILILVSQLGWLPLDQTTATERGVLMAFGVASATLYAAGLAFGAESLARTSVTLLSREEERYRLLARNMSDVISRHQRNGAVQFISQAAEAMLGMPVAQLHGHGLFDRVHVADRPAYLTALSDAARGGEGRSVEFRVKRDVPRAERGAGSAVEFIWVEMRCRPLDHAGASESEVVAVMRDVTDRKVQEQALDLARNAAEAADAAKTRFLATMSHELRTPLNAIIGFSEVIEQGFYGAVGHAKYVEYAHDINEAGRNLHGKIGYILEFANIEAGRYPLEPVVIDVAKIVTACADECAGRAFSRRIALNLGFTAVAEALADPLAVKRIVNCLLSNALLYTQEGGRVRVDVHEDEGAVVVCVADNGTGFTRTEAATAGSPFRSHARRGATTGMGMGLTIAMALARRMGGAIRIGGVAGEGTVAELRLPRL